MKKVGIIAGTGLPDSIDDVFDSKKEMTKTHNQIGIFEPYSIAQKGDTQFIIMQRHGSDSKGNPKITPAELVKKNVYEAIIYELTENHDVDAILGFTRVGHVNNRYALFNRMKMIGDGGIIIPDQFIPGTAAHSFGSHYAKTIHTGGDPFNKDLQEILKKAALEAGAEVFMDATYFYHGGDRFETKAEIEDIRRKTYLKNKIVGMTTVPEAQLAGQMNTPYAAMCFSVNPAEGISKTIKVSHNQTNDEMERGKEYVEKMYVHLIQNLSEK